MPLQGPMLARRWATASSASLDFHVSISPDDSIGTGSVHGAVHKVLCARGSPHMHMYTFCSSTLALHSVL